MQASERVQNSGSVRGQQGSVALEGRGARASFQSDAMDSRVEVRAGRVSMVGWPRRGGGVKSTFGVNWCWVGIVGGVGNVGMRSGGGGCVWPVGWC